MASAIAAVLITDSGLVVGNVSASVVSEMGDGRLMELSTDDVPRGSPVLPGIPSSIVTQTLAGTAKLPDRCLAREVPVGRRGSRA